MTMMIVMVMMEIRMEFNDDVPYGIIRHGWLGKPLQMEVLMGGNHRSLQMDFPARGYI